MDENEVKRNLNNIKNKIESQVVDVCEEIYRKLLNRLVDDANEIIKYEMQYEPIEEKTRFQKELQRYQEELPLTLHRQLEQYKDYLYEIFKLFEKEISSKDKKTINKLYNLINDLQTFKLKDLMDNYRSPYINRNFTKIQDEINESARIITRSTQNMLDDLLYEQKRNMSKENIKSIQTAASYMNLDINTDIFDDMYYIANEEKVYIKKEKEQNNEITYNSMDGNYVIILNTVDPKQVQIIEKNKEYDSEKQDKNNQFAKKAITIRSKIIELTYLNKVIIIKTSDLSIETLNLESFEKLSGDEIKEILENNFKNIYELLKDNKRFQTYIEEANKELNENIEESKEEKVEDKLNSFITDTTPIEEEVKEEQPKESIKVKVQKKKEEPTEEKAVKKPITVKVKKKSVIEESTKETTANEQKIEEPIINDIKEEKIEEPAKEENVVEINEQQEQNINNSFEEQIIENEIKDGSTFDNTINDNENIDYVDDQDIKLPIDEDIDEIKQEQKKTKTESALANIAECLNKQLIVEDGKPYLIDGNDKVRIIEYETDISNYATEDKKFLLNIKEDETTIINLENHFAMRTAENICQIYNMAQNYKCNITSKDGKIKIENLASQNNSAKEKLSILYLLSSINRSYFNEILYSTNLLAEIRNLKEEFERVYIMKEETNEPSIEGSQFRFSNEEIENFANQMVYYNELENNEEEEEIKIHK